MSITPRYGRLCPSHLVTRSLGRSCARGFGNFLVLLLLLPALVGGCTRFDRPLNALKVPLESRVTNQTRAAIGADLAPLDALDSQQIRPATQPGHAAANASEVRRCPTDDDGYFVGLAISGGGSRSANFGAAAMFQLQRLGMLQ